MRVMQAKDIPDEIMLRAIRSIMERCPGFGEQPRDMLWVSSFDMEATAPVLLPGTPFKVVMAKLRSLIKRGLIAGCGCGCRGDFWVTDKGEAAIVNRTTVATVLYGPPDPKLGYGPPSSGVAFRRI